MDERKMETWKLNTSGKDFTEWRLTIEGSDIDYTLADMVTLMRASDHALRDYMEACNRLRERFVDLIEDDDASFLYSVADGFTRERDDWQPAAWVADELAEYED